jgi:hypothetical protein
MGRSYPKGPYRFGCGTHASEKESPVKKNFARLLLLGLVACLPAWTLLSAEDKDDDDDEQETTIKFSEAPKAVQDTITKEVKGAKIETLTKEVEDGKTVYEAENVEIGGKRYDIEVAEDGKLLEKELADDDNAGKDGDDPKRVKSEDAAKK